MELLTSRLLEGFAHGFTTRAGGLSAPPWDALNLGDQVGDDPAAVAGNWRRLEAATGLAFARVRQVHGARVVEAAGPSAPVEEADAVVSGRPGVAACVAVADCVPVLLADPVTGAVAAVHAGWRGTVVLAAAEGARALARTAGAPLGRLVTAIGPSIGPCCYEVSEELAARFEAAFGQGVVVRGGPGGPRLDLWTANARALAAAGVERVDRLDRCTACDAARFFSHRRDAGRTGRMVGFIAPRPISSGRAVP
ncbi:MAG TPA: peptidoglycan editing factor PgeF [Anaeromyxobacteraceae bacterium]|nr:peptidoglycan editing factor PgeF [Anaeromyxobacteraceae bacterium]